MSKFAASNAHMSAVQDLIPGGAHTYAKGDDQYPDGMAPVIERGAGCRVWDLDGNEYVEFGSGLRSVTLGHGFEPVLDAVRRRLADGVNFARPHRIEREAAERLIDLIPERRDGQVRPQRVRRHHGRGPPGAGLHRARDGRGLPAAPVLLHRRLVHRHHTDVGRDPGGAERLTVQFSYNDLPSLAELFDRYPGQIAAVVLEAETVEPPAPGFFDGLRQLCDRHGALLILDEIITGFRWHERGAQFVYGIEPDLCAFGKGMANGFPLSALAGRREVMRLGGYVDDADRVFLLSQTAGAQPWALAAMLAVIDTYQRDQHRRAAAPDRRRPARAASRRWWATPG